MFVQVMHLPFGIYIFYWVWGIILSALFDPSKYFTCLRLTQPTAGQFVYQAKSNYLDVYFGVGMFVWLDATTIIGLKVRILRLVIISILQKLRIPRVWIAYKKEVCLHNAKFVRIGCWLSKIKVWVRNNTAAVMCTYDESESTHHTDIQQHN